MICNCKAAANEQMKWPEKALSLAAQSDHYYTSYASRSSVCSLDMQSWPPVWRYNTTMEGEYLWGLAAKSRYGEGHTLPY